ncbi:enoyl-CoA hydratase domain-containing protein 3, mitochondrial-like [Pomacea canaliculata]|uniref:enoyl-CoA hydratase domain-containing protein 3, mitochondrial-like n=1 Tax=Pomacea canaliculata TaxID=400727 RepID=UPI000D732956|nr:enoyl-CoA hydratase domain-containing protein 3, mitochondrial-like [Pomacea canaliculata]
MASLSRRLLTLRDLGSAVLFQPTRCISTSRQAWSQAKAALKPLLATSQDNGVRIICLSNPKQRNALSLRMLTELHAALSDEDKDLRVIIITHKGPVFSAGHDLKELTQETGKEYHEKVFSTCTSVMNLIQDLPVPVIAQVKGLATAAGCQLVATCDIAVASEESRFATPGIHVGVFCTTPGVAVGRVLPRKVALEMMFTGQPISAKDALLHGLISKVVAEEKVEEETLKIANHICQFSKEVITHGKAAFYAQMSLEKRAAYRFAERAMVDNLQLPDAQEGIRAFIEKRPPQWKY